MRTGEHGDEEEGGRVDVGGFVGGFVGSVAVAVVCGGGG